MTALTKVETPLMERYTLTCVQCGWVRQVFGTEQEARISALMMGWEFRSSHDRDHEMLKAALGHPAALRNPGFLTELAFCPHCALLIKETPCPSSK
jgi:hypothetical protein